MGYAVGDRVVCACRGAGIINRIVTKAIGGGESRYYVINTVGVRPMTLMVPVSRAEELGLRPVEPIQALRRELRDCCASDGAHTIARDYRVRTSRLGDLMHGGEFASVAVAVAQLHFLSIERRLGITDHQTLERGKRMLAAEWAVSSGGDMDSALAEVEEHLATM